MMVVSNPRSVCHLETMPLDLNEPQTPSLKWLTGWRNRWLCHRKLYPMGVPTMNFHHLSGHKHEFKLVVSPTHNTSDNNSFTFMVKTKALTERADELEPVAIVDMIEMRTHSIIC